MSIDRSDAERLVELVLRAEALCNEALKQVGQNDGPDQVQVIARLFGEFLVQSYTNILAPIWRNFPDLEPPEIREQGYVEHYPALSTQPQESTRSFVAEAHAALKLANDVIAQDGTALFDLVGLSEVQNTLAAIEDFLASPTHQGKVATELPL